MRHFPEILRAYSVDAKRWLAARTLARAIRFDRAFMVFWSFLTLAMIAAVGAAGVVIARQLTTPPPFTYSSHEYMAEQAELCPGDPVAYTITFTVHEVPTVIEIVRTVWQIDPPRTVVRDLLPTHAIWLETGTYSNSIAFPIPPLKPGAYELRSSGEDAAGGDIEWHVVKFNIRGDC